MATNSTPNKLWDEAEKPNKTRLPKTSLGGGSSTESPSIKSDLNAKAPEWFPANYVPPRAAASSTGPASSVQNRLSQFKPSNQSQRRPADCEEFSSSDHNRLQQIITTLSNDPGQFDNLVHIFLDTLAPYSNSISSLSSAAKLLVEQGIENPNFRYTGARLCCALEDYFSTFKAELHLTCKKELASNGKQQNVLLFISELYTQLHYRNIYSDLVIEAIKHLLSAGGNDNVKFVCQALKLTGYLLENDNKSELEGVFKQLEDVKPSLKDSIQSLVTSVFNLRAQQWGHRASEANSSQEPENGLYYDESHLAQNPILYTTDGEEFTNEQIQFLTSHMNLNEEDLSDLSDPDELCDPEPEMDEEIQAAFKEFVRLNK